jgi:hypothetical protein
MGTHPFRHPPTSDLARAVVGSGWKNLPLASVPALYLGITESPTEITPIRFCVQRQTIASTILLANLAQLGHYLSLVAAAWMRHAGALAGVTHLGLSRCCYTAGASPERRERVEIPPATITPSSLGDLILYRRSYAYLDPVVLQLAIGHGFT